MFDCFDHEVWPSERALREHDSQLAMAFEDVRHHQVRKETDRAGGTRDLVQRGFDHRRITLIGSEFQNRQASRVKTDWNLELFARRPKFFPSRIVDVRQAAQLIRHRWK